MDELLQHLEQRLKDLLNRHHQLVGTNQRLNEGRQTLTREKDLLLTKQQRAIAQVEQLVAKLKGIEKLS